MTKDESLRLGYTLAKIDCLRLLSKWFYMSNKEAKACRDEMQKLYAPKLKSKKVGAP